VHATHPDGRQGALAGKGRTEITLRRAILGFAQGDTRPTAVRGIERRVSRQRCSEAGEVLRGDPVIGVEERPANATVNDTALATP
jgi:hypothetical protein